MISLQKEMEQLIDNEVWTWLIIRHLTDQQCTCVRPESNTPDPSCPNCQGHKWIFNEYLIKGMCFYSPRMVAHEQDFTYGLSYNNIFEVYFPINKITEKISINDNLYQLKLATNGKLADPIIRTKRWIINDVYDLRLDGGEREFVKIFAKPSVLQ